MSEPSTPATEPVRRGHAGWLLTASLMLNTLLVGLFLGQALSGGGGAQPGWHAGPPQGTEARIASSIVQSIAPEQRDEIRRAFRASIRDVQPQLQERRLAQRALRDAIAAEPFDPAALDNAFSELQARETATQRAIQAALVEQFGSLSLEQRKAVADAIGKGRGNGKRPFRDRWRERRDSGPPERP